MRLKYRMNVCIYIYIWSLLFRLIPNKISTFLARDPRKVAKTREKRKRRVETCRGIIYSRLMKVVFREWQWMGHWASKTEERSAEREVKDNRVCSSPRYYWRRLLYPRQNERPTKQPPPTPDPHSADITCDRLPPRISNRFVSIAVISIEFYQRAVVILQHLES